MIKEKWLDYAIKILDSCNKGSGSISHIADDIGGSESYIAKVVASLRNANLINQHYDLCKPIANITISEVMVASNSCQVDSETSRKILEIIIKSLNIPITEVI